jgi:hypothetical protein
MHGHKSIHFGDVRFEKGEGDIAFVFPDFEQDFPEALHVVKGVTCNIAV